MCQVAVPIPDEVMYDRGLSVVKAQDLARRMTALGLYVTENVSLGYCSEVQLCNGCKWQEQESRREAHAAQAGHLPGLGRCTGEGEPPDRLYETFGY